MIKKSIAIFGFIFLYVPIALLIIYSFNENERAAVWTGFSTKWYGELLRNEQLMGAAWVSIQIAFLAATIATMLGVIVSFVLVRYSKFRARTLLDGMTTSPLVMPDVITGFSLLILFINMEKLLGWPSGRGMLTVILAHSTFCMAYVAVIVRSRLIDMDDSLEEAAQDLGAHPFFVFFQVTIPVIMPAIIAGWLLAFTLSLDDLVIASFTNGPSSSTLPMVVFSKVRLGVSPDVNVLATLIIGIVGIGVITAMQIMSRTQRKHYV